MIDKSKITISKKNLTKNEIRTLSIAVHWMKEMLEIGSVKESYVSKNKRKEMITNLQKISEYIESG